MRVFIENEAGSFVKHYHNEKTLEPEGESRVSRAYPFPYGFVLNTSAADGDNVDCFVLTTRALRTGQIVDCDPLGLMEQIEDGEEDHKILAGMPGDATEINDDTRRILREFVSHVFDHIPDKVITVGAFGGPEEAIRHVEQNKSAD